MRLTFTDCLGPCSEANVVLLYLNGRPLWFRRMNAPELLATRSFSWTGGGGGHTPPGDVS